MAGYLMANILINIVAIVAFLIDVITFPFWYFVQMPWKETRLMDQTHATKIDTTRKDEVLYRSNKTPHVLCKEANQKGIDTMEKMLNLLRQKYASRPCIATRQILSTENEVCKDTGKVWKKYNMGDYQWITYDQMFQRALAFGKGVCQIGYPAKTKVVMYADTRGNILLLVIKLDGSEICFSITLFM